MQQGNTLSSPPRIGEELGGIDVSGTNSIAIVALGRSLEVERSDQIDFGERRSRPLSRAYAFIQKSNRKVNSFCV
jgi:hypothetical protein